MSRRLRGFAAMDPEKQREAARKGGRSAHAQGKAHEWTSDEARDASNKNWDAQRNEKGSNP